MKRRRCAVISTAVAAVIVLSATQAVRAAGADTRGGMQSPISRGHACYLEGPNGSVSPACRALVAASGSRAPDDSTETSIAGAAGRHREIIPDGRLCSAGHSRHAGLDLVRGDWPATTLSSGAEHTFSYRALSPQRGTFEFYVTRDGYDPTRPLRWSDLEPAPFATVTDPRLDTGTYWMKALLPGGKAGRHVIYTIWQHSEDPGAFYSCSDVTFRSDSAGNPAPPGVTPPTAPVEDPTADPPSQRPPGD